MEAVRNSDAAAVIACALIGLQNGLRIHHWQTRSFAHHKASDELVGTLSGLTDKFMEALQGVQGKRLDFGDQTCSTTLQNVNDEEATAMIKYYRNWLLTDLQGVVELTPGLVNVRDEMVTALDSALYLFTFR
jgi:hypothetical protein